MAIWQGTKSARNGGSNLTTLSDFYESDTDPKGAKGRESRIERATSNVREKLKSGPLTRSLSRVK
jgi:hypothetical protein